MSINELHLAAAPERRARLMDALRAHPLTESTGGPPAAILFSPAVAARNSDVEHPFRADSDLAWLTGFLEPEAVLVLLPGRAEGESVLFLRARDPEQETWTGRRLGTERAPAALGVDEAHPIASLDEVLPALLYGRGSVWTLLGRAPTAHDTVLTALATARARARRRGVFPTALADLATVLHPMRHRKDAREVEALAHAVDISCAGHRRAMATCRPGTTEAALEAALTWTFRREGAARHGYNPIVAAGANACILHYDVNDAVVHEGDLVLIDAGAEVDLYTGDVTRTFPASGKFTPAQRDVYDVVLAANVAGIDKARPGATWTTVDDAARRVLVDGLIDLGVLHGDPEELMTRVPADDAPPWQRGRAPLDRFYMHSTGHWLGADVHDVGPYHDGAEELPFAPGMVLTVEPGLYLAGAEDIPAPLRDIGVRIEDDIVITDGAPRVLSNTAPKAPDEIEALVGAAEET